MRISDWSSDVCSSDLLHLTVPADIAAERCRPIVLQPLRLWHGPADYPGPPARPRLKPFQTRRCRQMAEEGQAPAFPCSPSGPTYGAALLQSRLQDRQLRHKADRRARPVSPEVQPVSRSEEHTSELQSLMRNSYAVFCLTKNTPCITNLHQ